MLLSSYLRMYRVRLSLAVCCLTGQGVGRKRRQARAHLCERSGSVRQPYVWRAVASREGAASSDHFQSLECKQTRHCVRQALFCTTSIKADNDVDYCDALMRPQAAPRGGTLLADTVVISPRALAIPLGRGDILFYLGQPPCLVPDVMSTEPI